jgi:branched-chain amino acid transport system ATP-binding protein
MSVLEARGCSIHFGGVQAARDVTLRAGEWEIVGVIGPNGAGKTTMFNIITGFYPPDEGSVWFKGDDVTRLAVHERTALGMGRTFQNVGLVKGSTVRENLLSAQHLEAGYSAVAGMLGAPHTFEAERVLQRRAEALADILGLSGLLDTRVAGLPYGVLKRVELAAVLATDPDLLLLDEPTSGMGPEEAHAFGDTLLELRREFELTVVMIEHHVPLVTQVCDYVYCLNFGEMLAEGTPEEVRSHPEVIRAYLGEEADAVVSA